MSLIFHERINELSPGRRNRKGKLDQLPSLLRDYRGRTTNVEDMNKVNSWFHLYYSIAPCFEDPSSSKVCRV